MCCRALFGYGIRDFGGNTIGKICDPEDLAGTEFFLASEASDYITGQTIFVDAGWLSM